VRRTIDIDTRASGDAAREWSWQSRAFFAGIPRARAWFGPLRCCAHGGRPPELLPPPTGAPLLACGAAAAAGWAGVLAGLSAASSAGPSAASPASAATAGSAVPAAGSWTSPAAAALAFAASGAAVAPAAGAVSLHHGRTVRSFGSMATLRMAWERHLIWMPLAAKFAAKMLQEPSLSSR
jgi:hypothetical protein